MADDTNVTWVTSCLAQIERVSVLSGENHTPVFHQKDVMGISVSRNERTAEFQVAEFCSPPLSWLVCGIFQTIMLDFVDDESWSGCYLLRKPNNPVREIWWEFHSVVLLHVLKLLG